MTTFPIHLEFDFWVKLVESAKKLRISRKEFVLRAITEKIERLENDQKAN